MIGFAILAVSGWALFALTAIELRNTYDDIEECRHDIDS